MPGDAAFHESAGGYAPRGVAGGGARSPVALLNYLDRQVLAAMKGIGDIATEARWGRRFTSRNHRL